MLLIGLRSAQLVAAAGEKDSDAIREDLLNAKIEQMGQESLRKKIGMLFALCPAPSDFDGRPL
ncbi:MAG: hypothetical protein WB524_00720 [Acidobacteriaceae bacterium]|jgi:hypothetical protein